MGTEIERKFLVLSDAWRAESDGGVLMRQGYLCVGPPTSVRVRLDGGRAFLNIKQSTLDIQRAEFEYAIPVADAEELLATRCVGATVEKTRHRVAHGGLVWEVDVFHGANAPLIVAEVELDAPDQDFERPAWVGEEVSGDPRYLNTYLSLHPYGVWTRA